MTVIAIVVVTVISVITVTLLHLLLAVAVAEYSVTILLVYSCQSLSLGDGVGAHGVYVERCLVVEGRRGVEHMGLIAERRRLAPIGCC